MMPSFITDSFTFISILHVCGSDIIPSIPPSIQSSSSPEYSTRASLTSTHSGINSLKVYLNSLVTFSPVGSFFSTHLQGNQQYCSIDDMFCIPANYSKFNPPLNPPGDTATLDQEIICLIPGEPPAEVQIGLDNFEILKIDDREFTIEINAYFIVKWRDKRIEASIMFLFLSSSMLKYCSFKKRQMKVKFQN